MFWKHHHGGCEPFMGLAWNGSRALFTLTSLLLSLLYWDAQLLCPHLHVWLLRPGQPGTADAPAPVVEALPDHPAAGNELQGLFPALRGGGVTVPAVCHLAGSISVCCPQRASHPQVPSCATLRGEAMGDLLQMLLSQDCWRPSVTISN